MRTRSSGHLLHWWGMAGAGRGACRSSQNKLGSRPRVGFRVKRRRSGLAGTATGDDTHQARVRQRHGKGARYRVRRDDNEVPVVPAIELVYW